MTTALSKSITYTLPTYALSEELRNKLRISKHYIKNHPSTTVHHVDINKAYMHVGDLYGYLTTMKILSNLHLATFIISDLDSLEAFGPGITILYIPDITLIQSFEE